MTKERRAHFDASTGAASAGGKGQVSGIWELPDEVIDQVGGANDFTQSTAGGGVNFAQNFSCFAQGIGDFSSGTPPRILPQAE